MAGAVDGDFSVAGLWGWGWVSCFFEGVVPVCEGGDEVWAVILRMRRRRGYEWKVWNGWWNILRFLAPEWVEVGAVLGRHLAVSHIVQRSDPRNCEDYVCEAASPASEYQREIYKSFHARCDLCVFSSFQVLSAMMNSA